MNSLIEFIDAAIDTQYVQSPFEERGGVKIVGFPGTFKTTIVKAAVESHNDAILVSDMNVHQWLKLREDFITGRYQTLAFTDFEKIYQRHASTSAHIEGIVKGLVAEGYGTGPSGDQRMPTPLARALVIGAMTSSCFERMYSTWQENGFLRRFLWLVVSVKNVNEISSAIRRWEKIDFGRISKVSIKPGSLSIPMNIPANIEAKIEKMMRDQAGYNGTAYILMKKICAVLLWKHSIDTASNGSHNRVDEILEDIGPALSKSGGRIVL